MAAAWRPRGATNLRLVSRLFSTGKHSKTAPDLRLKPYEFTHESIFNEEHAELRASLNKFIEKEINPFVDEWENAKRFPAHELFKKLGSAGFFGVNKPTKYGGLGLDYSFSVAMAEELGKKDVCFGWVCQRWLLGRWGRGVGARPLRQIDHQYQIIRVP